jgi:hypothetical protein
MENESKLFQTKSTEYGDQYKQHLFEQYQLYVESAEKISDRRHSTNNHFIAINTALISLIGLSFQTQIFQSVGWARPIIAAIGVIICVIFWFMIHAYKQLNTAKFNVIHQIESHLPLSLYKYEWEHPLKEGKDPKTYYPFSHIELLVPWVFGALYFVLCISFLM